jgi:hypothetical protein
VGQGEKLLIKTRSQLFIYWPISGEFRSKSEPRPGVCISRKMLSKWELKIDTAYLALNVT